MAVVALRRKALRRKALLEVWRSKEGDKNC